MVVWCGCCLWWVVGGGWVCGFGGVCWLSRGGGVVVVGSFNGWVGLGDGSGWERERQRGEMEGERDE